MRKSCNYWLVICCRLAELAVCTNFFYSKFHLPWPLNNARNWRGAWARPESIIAAAERRVVDYCNGWSAGDPFWNLIRLKCEMRTLMRAVRIMQNDHHRIWNVGQCGLLRMSHLQPYKTGHESYKFSFQGRLGGHGLPALTHVSLHVVKVQTQVVTRINYKEKKML